MVSAIVLAAGSSKRMGDINKLLLSFDKTTLINHVVSEIKKSKALETIVVTGFEYHRIKKELQNHDLIFYHNGNFHLGLTSSIQTGVLNCQSNGFMICLSDMVKLTADDYNLLIDQFEKSFTPETPCIIVPHHNGKKGNPVIFSRHFKELILHNENPEGCKNIIAGNSQYIIEVQMPDDHILIDIDVPRDYKRLAK